MAQAGDAFSEKTGMEEYEMKKLICMVLAACLLLALCGCGATKAAAPETAEETRTDAAPEESAAPAEEAPETEPFAYVHDPRQNPEAMADIVENPDAVYGFSPNPESARLGSYASYDWTDPALVAKAQEERRAYHESMDSMTDILYRMRDEGATLEEMARAVSAERNRLRLASYDNDPEGLAAVKESNLKTYGHEEGPTPDELFAKYGTWTLVLQRAFSANMGMDACCGLYDEYYPLYIELGYVEDTGESAALPDS